MSLEHRDWCLLLSTRSLKAGGDLGCHSSSTQAPLHKACQEKGCSCSSLSIHTGMGWGPAMSLPGGLWAKANRRSACADDRTERDRLPYRSIPGHMGPEGADNPTVHVAGTPCAGHRTHSTRGHPGHTSTLAPAQ